MRIHQHAAKVPGFAPANPSHLATAPAARITPATGEEPVRFSACNLWNEQRRFFIEEGIEAWNGKLPYHATSNPIIANAYAQLIVRFLADRARSGPLPPGPAYLLELGGGSGLFGFYLVRRLLELRAGRGAREPGFVYVMSDLSRGTLDFWRGHGGLRDLLDGGVLDFACYDVGASRTITLLESGVVLKPEDGGTPLVVLANYLFDTLPVDIFRVEAGTLLEGRTRGLPAGAALPSLSNDLLSLRDLGIELDFRAAERPCYDDPLFESLLDGYTATLSGKSFLFPIHALVGLCNLIDISGGRLLLLATDKAHLSRPPEISPDTQDLAFHDSSFSLMANFHALGGYFEARGGVAVHPAVTQAINASVFCLGEPWEQYAETRTALATFFHQWSPGGLHALFDPLLHLAPSASPEVLVALLEASLWDPWMVSSLIDPIVAAAKAGRPDIRSALANGMRRAAEQFYYLPDVESTLAHAGTFFQEIEDFPTALAYYRRSLDVFADEGAERPDLYSSTLYNMGLCHYYLGDREAALAAFKQSDQAATRPDMMAKGWIHHLTVEGAERPG
jgi:hypothetical protein